MRPMVMILLILTVLLWLAVLLAGLLPGSGWAPASAKAQIGASAGGAPAQAVTPSPAPPASSPVRATPILGILVLLAPAVFLVWKNSRPNANKKRTSGCCLPIIDEDRPSSW